MTPGVARDWYPSRRLKGETTFRQDAKHGPEWEFGILVSRTTYDALGRVTGSQAVDPGSRSFDLPQKWRGR